MDNRILIEVEIGIKDNPDFAKKKIVRTTTEINNLYFWCYKKYRFLMDSLKNKDVSYLVFNFPEINAKFSYTDYSKDIQIRIDDELLRNQDEINKYFSLNTVFSYRKIKTFPFAKALEYAVKNFGKFSEEYSSKILYINPFGNYNYNDWNCWIEKIEKSKEGKLIVWFYWQDDHTDYTELVPLTDCKLTNDSFTCYSYRVPGKKFTFDLQILYKMLAFQIV